MKLYTVVLRVESDDDMSPEEIRHQLFDATGDVDFGFDIASIERRYLSLSEIDGLAALIHADQTDKIGVPYVEHVRAVSDALAPFGEVAQMAGLLHDGPEDNEDWPLVRLLAGGVHPGVVELVRMVTNTPGENYLDKIRKIAENKAAARLKTADNGHNSREDRRKHLDGATRSRLDKKYKAAREILWGALDPADVERILERVNPDLLPEMHEFYVKREAAQA